MGHARAVIPGWVDDFSEPIQTSAAVRVTGKGRALA